MIRNNRAGREQIAWAEIHWPRPLEVSSALALLTQLATTPRVGHIVFEVRARLGKAHYLLGARPEALERIRRLFCGELANLRFSDKPTRGDVALVRGVRLSRPQLALNTGNQAAITRAVLASLAQCRHQDDETVLQVMLGRSFAPSLLPNKLSDPAASWLDVLRGTVAPASPESRALMKDKVAHHGFAAALRVGSVAGGRRGRADGDGGRSTNNSDVKGADVTCPIPKSANHIRAVLSALKVAESTGVRLYSTPDKARSLNLAKCPWFYPMRLSVKELLTILAWPLGEEEFVGVAGLHPRTLLPPPWYKGEGRAFGLASGFGSDHLKLGIPARDSLEHTVLLGPTGAGKSTAMLNLILADIDAGRSVLVIDPKADLVNDTLARIPESRLDDVVVLDPTDACPVGFNPLADKARDPSLIADGVLAVFRDIFTEAWGIRTQDILSAALLTLVRYGRACGGASLVMLPALLTDAVFRQKIVAKAATGDPLGLGAFWAGFEAMSAAERNQHIAPVMNKIRQFMLRPELRAVLGQLEPRFSLGELFSGRHIVLVPLNKGIIGTEAARLLGSLVVGQLWALALGRASLPKERRRIASVFIDEVQDYLSLPTDLADALSQARGLGVGLTVAHQYRAQLPTGLRAGIDANAKNKVVFGLNATDARDMAAMASGESLEALDFQLLPRFGVYASLQQGGRATGWVSGSTIPAPPSTGSPADARARSQARYGRDAKAVEQGLLGLLGHGSTKDTDKGKAADAPIGRRKRGKDGDR